MKVLAIALASLATVAVATPTGSGQQCKPATYRCDPNPRVQAWNVCNTSGQWVFAGTCPPKTVCKFLPANGSPYCVPPGFTIP
ncbi:hypothetical protein VFPFJ_10761 [Purpureocillium lilacinum]|uniref:Uncharacterized protein n=2 Tax=Purpureocillium lilacinum TaxID=33203 RepID=A0A179GRK1_PURLI|nr:hypothetical protein VFPFJ_10761 [Purpureocillium lilacinum]KAK4090400.1 hypothetical protein Purlil1_5072 [Purpureocillium lilacinum]OAQ75771.1 hypothetical protein VFPFJ_10761 [Purpureocillium lilacinum]OAQ80576.1 hypothetical protein VFPBJ_06161 [Purpureocillium lilacinum]PWI70831.1 hypothetical protein PCL_12199 [Purpureocillium lilacinum]GJN74947.1 hypothetical protein PLICBS_009040 [Purpureocillium lilacinum]